MPSTRLFGKSPDYWKIIKWGSRVVVLDMESSHKFDYKGSPALFVGYPGDHQAHEVWLLKERKFAVSRDVHTLSPAEDQQFEERYGSLIPKCEQQAMLKRLAHQENDTSGDRILDNELQGSMVNCDDQADDEEDLSRKEEVPQATNDSQPNTAAAPEVQDYR